jgi:hypothetical protein
LKQNKEISLSNKAKKGNLNLHTLGGAGLDSISRIQHSKIGGGGDAAALTNENGDELDFEQSDEVLLA